MDEREALSNAANLIRSGGIVIFPTDTAFGIGCRMDDRKAVDRLFAVRQRPRSQATPLLVDSIGMALSYFRNPPDVVRTLMLRYWPGALTVVSRCRVERVYAPVRGGSGTVGLRLPDHPVPLALIEAAGVPIIGTSANIHGRATPYTSDDLDPELTGQVDMVIPGRVSVGIASTVVDCSVRPSVVRRQGSVHIPEEVLRAS